MFGEETLDEFEKALESMKNTQGLIIDVRDN
jgi:C-terminal processing protease CtpA/Prc